MSRCEIVQQTSGELLTYLKILPGGPQISLSRLYHLGYYHSNVNSIFMQKYVNYVQQNAKIWYVHNHNNYCNNTTRTCITTAHAIQFLVSIIINKQHLAIASVFQITSKQITKLISLLLVTKCK